MTMSKEMKYEINYETIGSSKQRVLIETTRITGRFLTEEEFNEIMTVYKKVIDRVCIETELLSDE